MHTINLDYDKQYDILYARFPFSGHSYGEEDDNGVVTFHNIETDNVTGIAVYDFKTRLIYGNLNLKSLPVSLDSVMAKIQKLISS